MNITVRADASAKIGSGHVMRCLTLAEACSKRGARVRFICRNHPGNLAALIESRGFPVEMLPCGIVAGGDVMRGPLEWLGVNPDQDVQETRIAIKQGEPCDWLIVDHYGIDRTWELALRGRSRKIMVIDDLADRAHDCDLLLDQNFRQSDDGRYAGLVPGHCILAMGPQFALLQNDYLQWRERIVPRTEVKRVLVYFGGVDAAGLTGMAIRAALAAGLTVDAVVSPQDVHRVALEHAAASGLTLHQRLPSLAPLIATSDLGIGAFGATSWERLCLGLPSIAVTLAKNQQGVADALIEAGLALTAGPANKASESGFAAVIGTVLAMNGLADWSQRCLTICDGQGAGRIADMLWKYADDKLDRFYKTIS